MEANGSSRGRSRTTDGPGSANSRTFARPLGALIHSPDIAGRAAVLRHVALIIAASTAYVFRGPLKVDNRVLWILGAAAALNLVAYLLASQPASRSLGRNVSPAVGVACWVSLIHVTGGVSSPFVAALAFEVLLAATSFPITGAVLVTLGGAAGLWLQQAVGDLPRADTALAVQTSVLCAIGGVSIFLARRWQRAHETLAQERAKLQERLVRLEEEMEEVRRLGEVGENVARLAHGLKNAVHSLRGFSALIESGTDGPGAEAPVLAGLKASVARLEDLARQILAPHEPAAAPRGSTFSEVGVSIETALAEVSRTYPNLTLHTDPGVGHPPLRIPADALNEVVLILLRNAAEAMGGRGTVHLETSREIGQYAIRVRDHGPALEPENVGRLFRPGFSTKPGGSGFGLFLARRIAESHGGAVSASAAAGGGMAFTLTLPVGEG